MLKKILLTVAWLLLAGGAAANTVTFQQDIYGHAAMTDAWLDSTDPTNNKGNSDQLRADTAGPRAALVRFKIFAAEGGPIPNGATVTSATLLLYKHQGNNSATFEARRVLRDWVENQVTWNNATSTVSWTTAGALGSGSDVASSADGQGAAVAGQWLSVDVTASVQAYAAGAANYGWRIGYVSGDTGSSHRFRSSESTTGNEHPKLTITYTGAPIAPANLGAVIAAGPQINLTWSDLNSDETGTKIERKTGSGGTYAEIGTVGANVTAYSDSAGLTPGNTYYYRVRATNGSGDSSYSAATSVAYVVPSAPSSLTLSVISQTQIDLSWSNVSNETGYKIERKTGAGGTYVQIANRGVDVVTYNDTGLSAASIYYYRVRAYNHVGDSAYTAEKFAATPPPDGPSNATGGTILYKYDPFGNLVETNAGGVVTTMQYDIRGRKISMNDKNMGTWTYEYNALGELVKQTDAKGQTTTMQYDLVGRMTRRDEPDLVSRWSYDAYPTTGQDPNWDANLLGGLVGDCAKGIGKLCFASAGNDYRRLATYDTLGRSKELKTKVDNTATAYTLATAYVASGTHQGKVDTITYPTGLAVQHVYNAQGYLSELQEGGTMLWRATALSAAGRVKDELTEGSSVTTTRTFDALERLGSIVASNGGGAIHNIAYSYDTIGNVTQRQDAVRGITETLTYDSLNRLTMASAPTLVTRALSYDSIGNITYKSDVGTYAYPALTAPGPHAVSTVTSNGTPNSVTATYLYDANGNLATASGTVNPSGSAMAFARALAYASFNLPSHICQAQGAGAAAQVTGGGMDCTASGGTIQYKYSYTYSAEHERVRLVAVRADGTTTTVYVHPGGKGSLAYEKETRPDGAIEHRSYLAAYGETVGIRVQTGETPSAATSRFFHRDALGSVMRVTNGASAVLETMSYEAFGERRDGLTGLAQLRDSPLLVATTDRGFTSHEHLDELNLIHMNGRVYDPVLARFMTADPILDGATDLQSFNRYSYVNNNPLAYTDPSGHFKLKSLFKVAAVAAAAYFTAGAVSGAIWGSIAAAGPPTLASVIGMNVAAGAAGGFTFGFLASGGNFESGLQGALSGGLFGGATGFGTAFSAERIAAHAVAGCISGAASGAGCGSQAIAAGIGKGITGELPSSWGPVGQGVAVAVVGGTASAIGGGNFANGAKTAAFGYMFNNLALTRIMQGLQYAWGRAQVAAGEAMRSPIGQLAMDFAYGEIGTVAPRGGVVLGHFSDKLHSPNYIDVARMSGARAFQIDEGVWNAFTPQQRLEANLRFLDHAVAQGWEIKLSGPLMNVNSAYARELRYLSEKHGLVPNETWTKMIDPRMQVPQ